MFLKRQIPIIIVIGIGFLTLTGHFIKHEGLKSWIDNDSTLWFDIIASFAIVLGALNLLKLQFLKVINNKRNWQYSIIAIGGFFFAIFCGFLYRGTNYVTLSEIHPDYVNEVAMIIAEETEGLSSNISDNLSASLVSCEVMRSIFREDPMIHTNIGTDRDTSYFEIGLKFKNPNISKTILNFIEKFIG